MVGYGTDDRGYLLKAGPHRGPPATFARHELVSVFTASQQKGLQDPLRAYGRSEFLNSLFIKDLPWLEAVGNDLRDVD
jgi:hypothetical protein